MILSKLFDLDWFLLKFGFHLEDQDLIKILCLNRSINQKALPIFRKHFLNVPLQKTLSQLIDNKGMSDPTATKIEKMFLANHQSLNPNLKVWIPFDSDFDVQVKISFPQLFPFVEDHSEPERDGEDWVPLVVIASREKLHEMTKTMLLHKRFNFKSLQDSKAQELLIWASWNGEVEVIRRLMEHSYLRQVIGKYDPLPDRETVGMYMIEHTLMFAIVASIVNDKIDCTRELTKVPHPPIPVEEEGMEAEEWILNPLEFDVGYWTFRMLENCVQLKRIDHFKMLLSAPLCRTKGTQDIIDIFQSASSKGWPLEFVISIWKAFFPIRRDDLVDAIRESERIDSLFQIFSQQRSINVENEMAFLQFAKLFGKS